MRKRGFTLIELLVVVAIIAVLVAILLPALTRARDLAQQSVCMARLKSCAAAILMYGYDNADKIFIYYTRNGGNHKSWVNALEGTYLADLQTVQCPTYPPAKFLSYWQTYGFCYPDDEIRADLSNPAIGVYSWGLAMNRIDEPAEYLLVADSSYPQTHSIFPRQATMVVTKWIASAPSGFGQIHMRHLGKADGAFLDGHVESADSGRLKDVGVDWVMERDGTVVPTSH